MTEEQANKIIQGLSELSKNTATLQKNVNHLVNLKIIEIACSPPGNYYKMDQALKFIFKLNDEYKAKQTILDSIKPSESFYADDDDD